jgi:dipeptidyl aminopeptidase/acylaminoacyl peptidase
MSNARLNKPLFLLIALLQTLGLRGQVQPPESLLLDGIPPVAEELKNQAAPYLEFRSAILNSWHPREREMLITTRFADTMQLHRLRMPGGARQQLTFSPEPVAGGSYQRRAGNYILFAQDTGGGEFYQLYRYDPGEGKTTLLTDGRSRNMGGRWARSGKFIAFTSTRRNGADNDIYVMDPAEPASAKMVLQVTGGGWGIDDWSHDEKTLLLSEVISINKSHLHLLDLASGKSRQVTPQLQENVSYGSARFSANDKSIYVTTDRGSEFQRLVEFDAPQSEDVLERPKRVLTAEIPWDIEEMELSEDGTLIAFVANESGVGKLHVMPASGKNEIRLPKLPAGLISNLLWHENGRDLAFNLSSAKSPADVYSLDIRSRTVQRWTESETGGLDASRFREPELVRLKSFDGLEISAFVYRPDPAKFPGRRPVLVNIHGGPEAQARPGFQARNNFFLEEMGIAIIYPNVRGSHGYGKTFLTLDNGFKREDSVKDIGTILDWVGRDPGLDRERTGVIGGSYGGYMVLASMIHFDERLRCGVDVVGISNFLTFLKNTQDYRRDLRRVEYGDERQEAMREFLEKISPTTNVGKIRKPLLVVQGKNDPRVPLTESEQMVKAIRDNGGAAWYLMAKDEGHGFAKKRNADFQFLVTIRFLREYLLK